jgi:hypothetical protein
MARSCNSRRTLIVAAKTGAVGYGGDSRADAAVARQGLRAAGGAQARNVAERSAPTTGLNCAASRSAHPYATQTKVGGQPRSGAAGALEDV